MRCGGRHEARVVQESCCLCRPTRLRLACGGVDAIPLVSENPYRLARDIKGIGFLTADQVAARLVIEKTAMIRARAGISYTLAEAVSRFCLT